MSNASEHPSKEPEVLASSSTDAPPTTAEAVVLEEPQFKVYRPPNTTSSLVLAPLPDEYFNMTPADLKAAQDTLSARTNAMTNAPLQLRAAREASEQAKRDRWHNTTIRIRFNDRTQLERAFPSTDKIRSIYAFVRGCLREDVKPIKFILYQPPKRDLKVSDLKVRDQSLIQLQLAPSSVLLLRFEDEALNGTDVPAPLAPSVLARAVDLPTPPDFDASKTSTGTKQASKPTSSNSASNNVEKKLPKWLKLGHKK